jgi:hypothetical protein
MATVWGCPWCSGLRVYLDVTQALARLRWKANLSLTVDRPDCRGAPPLAMRRYPRISCCVSATAGFDVTSLRPGEETDGRLPLWVAGVQPVQGAFHTTMSKVR